MLKNLNGKFLKIADAVSFGMGTPTNILFWILAVAIWFFLGYTQRDLFVNAQFLPDWFTSNSWNFPLNTITTLAELYIGFLVAAATNRAERELRHLLESTHKSVERIKKINDKQNEILDMLMKNMKQDLKKEDEIMQQVKKVEKKV